MKPTSIFRKAAIALPFVAAALACYPAAERVAADANPGAQIVAQGTKNGAVACARCHGFDGMADGSGAFPKLAGQPADYLENELRGYISGNRKNALMQPIAKGLNDGEIKAVAQYYAAARGASITAGAQPPAEVIARGQQIAKEGDAAAGVMACETCHGVNGQGNAPIPYLASQYRQYTVLQMQMYRQGLRKSDLMADLARSLREKDAAAVAAYYEQVARPATK